MVSFGMPQHATRFAPLIPEPPGYFQPPALGPLLVFLTGLLLLTILPGDAPESHRQLLRSVPRLSHAVAFHLLRDDDAAFGAFCLSIGTVRTQAALSRVYEAIPCDSPDEHARGMRELYPFVLRLANVMDSEFERPEFARLHLFRASLGDSMRSHRLATLELDRVQKDASTPLSEKVAHYQALAERFERFGDERELMNIEGALARDIMQDGLLVQRVRLLHSALDRARRLGEQTMICQFLGELGEAYDLMGARDSAIACYAEGIERADERRIPDQAARLRMFLSRQYFNEGRLALGAQLLREALEACRRLGGSPLEYRVVSLGMNAYANYGCWPLVRQGTERLPVLQRELERNGYPAEALRAAIAGRRWRSRWLAATGRASEAADSLARLLTYVRATIGREGTSPLLSEHAEALLEAGRMPEALAAAEAGMAYADSMYLYEASRRLSLLHARSAIVLGALDAATRSIARSLRRLPGEPGPPLDADYRHFGLAARVALERGDLATAKLEIERGLTDLRRDIASLDRGPMSDLRLHQAEDLWLAGHRLFGRSAGEELAFELRWRALVSSTSARGPAPPGTLAAPVAGELQLFYAITPDGLVRWTRFAQGVRRDVLAISPARCEQAVDQVIRLASNDPSAPEALMPSELSVAAASLGREVLPPELRTARYPLVTVSAEGPLGRLPFELLSCTGEGTYEPLLLRHDVVYARPVQPRAVQPAAGGTLLLVDAAASGASQAGREPLAPLTAVDGEIAAARQALPEVRILRGPSTTKSAMLRDWSQASRIYVAAHLVRDPDAPLFQHFPIRFAGETRALEDNSLDVRDIREADLRGCQLVVLSSCASGEPYVVGKRSGPSMADAFLDAGASSVIHTRWRVRDDDAAVTAPRLAAAWLAGSGGGHDAWISARRELMQGPGGIRHPFHWAAWSVTRAAPLRASGTTPAGLTAKPLPAVPVARDRPVANLKRGG